MALTIRSDIPFGNVCDTAIGREGRTTVVEFAADPHGGPEALWFCFRLQQRGRPKAPGKIKLILKHVGTLLAGMTPQTVEHTRPVVRYSGEDWQRLEPGVPEWTPDRRQRAVWMIDAPTRFVDIAYCYPYGREELHSLLNDCAGYWRCDTVGVSQGARPLLRLSNDFGELDGKRPGIYLIARQHSGETPGSWVLDGLLRRLAALGDRAPLVWCVPLANIDGIEQGDYGKDSFPHDLARAWGRWPMRHETLVMQRDMRLWAARCAPALALDFHAPGPAEADGIYGFVRWAHQPEATPNAPDERAERWAAAIQKALGDYASDRFARVATHGGRWLEHGVFKEFCDKELHVPSIAFECSYSAAGSKVLDRADYQDAGRRFADALAS